MTYARRAVKAVGKEHWHGLARAVGVMDLAITDALGLMDSSGIARDDWRGAAVGALVRQNAVLSLQRPGTAARPGNGCAFVGDGATGVAGVVAGIRGPRPGVSMDNDDYGWEKDLDVGEGDEGGLHDTTHNFEFEFDLRRHLRLFCFGEDKFFLFSTRCWFLFKMNEREEKKNWILFFKVL